MPRHLISDAHEWINEIPTVPIYYLAKPQPRERAWKNQRGKKTLLSLTLVRLVKRHERCRISGSFGDSEIPLLSSFLYLFGVDGPSRALVLDFRIKRPGHCR
jgi:hypothetical protein